METSPAGATEVAYHAGLGAPARARRAGGGLRRRTRPAPGRQPRGGRGRAARPPARGTHRRAGAARTPGHGLAAHPGAGEFVAVAGVGCGRRADTIEQAIDDAHAQPPARRGRAGPLPAVGRPPGGRPRRCGAAGDAARGRGRRAVGPAGPRAPAREQRALPGRTGPRHRPCARADGPGAGAVRAAGVQEIELHWCQGPAAALGRRTRRRRCSPSTPRSRWPLRRKTAGASAGAWPRRR